MNHLPRCFALYILLWFVSFCSPFVLACEMCLLLVYYITAWFGSLRCCGKFGGTGALCRAVYNINNTYCPVSYTIHVRYSIPGDGRDPIQEQKIIGGNGISNNSTILVSPRSWNTDNPISILQHI